MKVENDMLYILIADGEKEVFNGKGEAIENLRKLVNKKRNLNNLEIIEIDMSSSVESGWDLAVVPWRDIATELIK